MLPPPFKNILLTDYFRSSKQPNKPFCFQVISFMFSGEYLIILMPVEDKSEVHGGGKWAYQSRITLNFSIKSCITDNFFTDQSLSCFCSRLVLDLQTEKVIRSVISREAFAVFPLWKFRAEPPCIWNSKLC